LFVHHLHLSAEEATAAVVPKEGGRVQHLVDRRSGRELLLQRSAPEGPRVDFLASCTGGWDELFPNDSEWGGYPDHGVLWTTAFAALADRGERAVTLQATIPRPPVEIVRRLELLDEPRRGLRAETSVRATAAAGPFLWAAHPMLRVEPGWRIELPDGARDFAADTQLHGRFEPGEVLGPERWSEIGATIPAPQDRVCDVVYVDGVSEAVVRSPNGDRATRVSWDASFLSHLWVVTITGCFGLDHCLLIEPCTTRPYRLEEAVPAGSAVSMSAGDTVEWWIEIESLDLV
jgi:hypothetical protein